MGIRRRWMQYFPNYVLWHMCGHLFHGEILCRPHQILFSSHASTVMRLMIELLPAWQRQAEIILQFITGSLDMSETYCDELRLIATKYLSSPSGFCFDFATSLPWSLNDYYVYKVKYSPTRSNQSNTPPMLMFWLQKCIEQRGQTKPVNDSARVLRVGKILRILKIVRILKAVKVVE